MELHVNPFHSKISDTMMKGAGLGPGAFMPCKMFAPVEVCAKWASALNKETEDSTTPGLRKLIDQQNKSFMDDKQAIAE